RIQKVLSEMGVCSRRAAEQLMTDGRVKLNGRLVKPGDKMDTRKDLLSVDGKNITVPKIQELYYEMLYKPRGYITTMADERGRKTVMELMTDIPARVFPVGRLDKDSEGLLLFTNDGDFANLLMHPSNGISKLYRVTVRPHATEEQLIRLSEGVTLDDGTKTLPAIVRVALEAPERSVLEMTIKEGKNREIRRMCEAVNLTVIRLKRSSEGPVKLGMLQPGKHRPLTKAEIAGLKASAEKATRKEDTETQQERAETYKRKGPIHRARTN
ncbi:MAG: pseudouridine synthase, partial [Pygmaiobacter sp.]